MHGFSYNENHGTRHDYDQIEQWIAELHPGQLFISLPEFEGILSSRPLVEQVPKLIDKIRAIVKGDSRFSAGYHFLGHSQGGLLLRIICEEMDDHKVAALVTMAGVQEGVFGIPFLQGFFGNVSSEVLTEVMYTSLLQSEFSVAGYWHSPLDNEKPYLANAFALPYWNGLLPEKVNETMRFRENFLRIRRAVLLGSPNDGTVEPWNTALMGFYAVNSATSLVPMQQTAVYVRDTFGLKELDGQGRLQLIAVDGVRHAEWLSNRTNFVVNVLPILT